MRIAAAGIPSTYKITRSLRFDVGASAILSRTYGSASGTTDARRKATFSMWVKRGSIGTYNGIFGLNYSGSGASQSVLYLAFLSNSKLEVGNQVSNSNAFTLTTTQVFRDTTAWMHIVLQIDTTQATSSDRLKIWINGSQVTAFDTATYPSLNYDTLLGLASNNRIGSTDGGGSPYLPFDGYLANFYYCDGQTKIASDFGKSDTSTGVWAPKAYNGLYGSHGFFLDFADNSAATSSTLGKDRSGNGNDWTPVNISVALGAGNDSVTDSPSTYGDGKNGRGNYCTLNPLAKSSNATVTNGGLEVSIVGAAGAGDAIASTISVGSGKWYCEVTPTSNTGGGVLRIGAYATGTLPFYGTYVWGSPGYYSYGYDYRGDTGNKTNNNSGSAYGSTYTTNDVIGIAIDCDSGKIWFSKNGTWQNSGDPAAGTGEAFSGLTGFINVGVANGNNGGTTVYAVNFGQQSHDATNVFKYAPPTGFKAICTANLPTPSIRTPNTAFDVALYTGNGSTQSITSLGFQPDLVWIKNRTGTATDHAIYDAVRGVQKQVESNQSTGETTETTGLTAFGSTGFTVGALAQVNTNTSTYVAWTWKANGAGSSNTSGTITTTASVNASAGISVLKYTGTGANGTIGHGLGVAPNMVIVRRTDNGNGWIVYHANQNASPASGYLRLNTTDLFTSSSTMWNSTTPTSSVISLGSNSETNGNTFAHLAITFAEVSGFSRFGSYTGNASTDGPFVWCGFRPKFVLIKNASAATNWEIMDSSRDVANPALTELYPNASSAENASTSDEIDFLSNGFKIRSSNSIHNANGNTMVFAAFAESPFKTSRAR